MTLKEIQENAQGLLADWEKHENNPALPPPKILVQAMGHLIRLFAELAAASAPGGVQRVQVDEAIDPDFMNTRYTAIAEAMETKNGS